jgi:hypothetical protein
METILLVFLRQNQDSFGSIGLSGGKRSQERKNKEGSNNRSSPPCSVRARVDPSRYALTNPERECDHKTRP